MKHFIKLIVEKAKKINKQTKNHEKGQKLRRVQPCCVCSVSDAHHGQSTAARERQTERESEETDRQREHSMTRQVKGSSQALQCSKMSLPADADLARGNNKSTVGNE